MFLSRTTLTLAATVAAALLSACAATSEPQPRRAVVELRAVDPPQSSASAPLAGELRFREWKDTVVVSGQVQNLTTETRHRLPGHAVHIHEGDCSAPNAGSIGGIFNPTNKRHSMPGGGMVGDLPMLRANPEGVAVMEDFLSPKIKLDGPDSVIGKVVVIHRDSDDWAIQPDGNAGPVIACGVIQAVKPGKP
jgi:Cu-Zn family superoxide dismutase